MARLAKWRGSVVRTMVATFAFESTRGECSRFVRRTMSTSRHSSIVTMAPWVSAKARKMFMTDSTG